jgi:hypothetical protein
MVEFKSEKEGFWVLGFEGFSGRIYPDSLGLPLGSI